MSDMAIRYTLCNTNPSRKRQRSGATQVVKTWSWVAEGSNTESKVKARSWPRNICGSLSAKVTHSCPLSERSLDDSGLTRKATLYTSTRLTSRNYISRRCLAYLTAVVAIVCVKGNEDDWRRNEEEERGAKGLWKLIGCLVATKTHPTLKTLLKPLFPCHLLHLDIYVTFIMTIQRDTFMVYAKIVWSWGTNSYCFYIRRMDSRVLLCMFTRKYTQSHVCIVHTSPPEHGSRFYKC